MKSILTLLSAGLLFISTSCNKTSMQDVQPPPENSSLTAQRVDPTVPLPEILTRTVYYNTNRFEVKVMPYDNSQMNTYAVVNTMYIWKEPALAGTARLIPVVTALPEGDFSMHALWEIVYINFGIGGLAPHQFLSADEISSLLAQPHSPLIATKTGTFVEMKMAPLQVQPASIN